MGIILRCVAPRSLKIFATNRLVRCTIEEYTKYRRYDLKTDSIFSTSYINELKNRQND
jgi:hypothetical protein